MDAIRTPEERFNNLKDYPFDAHYEGAGHFIQDDAGEALAQVVIDFIRANPR